MFKIKGFLSLALVSTVLGIIVHPIFFIGSFILAIYTFDLSETAKRELDNKADFKRLNKRYLQVKDTIFEFAVTLTNGEKKVFAVGPACLHGGIRDSSGSGVNDLKLSEHLFTSYHSKVSYSNWNIVDAKFSFTFQLENKKVIKLLNGESIGTDALLQLHKTA